VLELEKTVIREDVLIKIKDLITPILSQIKNELSFLIEYSPDKPIEIKMTRQRGVIHTEETEYLKEDDDVKNVPTYRRQSPHTNLVVTFPTGEKIRNTTAKKTFCETIEKIGVERIEKLNSRAFGDNIISKKKNERYQQEKTKHGYYILTHSNTRNKQSVLQGISDKLALGLTIRSYEKKESNTYLI